MSRISSFYTPFLKYKHQDVRRAPPRPPRSAPKLTRLASQADRASLPKLTVPRFPTQVELVSPMEHVLNLLRSFHNTLVENGQDGSQLDEVIKIFDPANQRYDRAARPWRRVDVEEKLTQQEKRRARCIGSNPRVTRHRHRHRHRHRPRHRH